MSLSGDHQRYALIAAAAVVAVVGLFVVSGALGGGSSNSGDSAQQVLDRAFSSAPQQNGGRIHGTMSVSVSGAEAAAAGLSQPFSMTVDGVSNPPRAGRSPAFDITVDVKGRGESHSVRVLSTGRKGYMAVDGKTYELPSAQLRRFSSPQGGPTSAVTLSKLGVNPGNWVRNVSDAGTASVGGEQTRHVIADVDVPLMLTDVMKVADQTGQAQQVPDEARKAIRDAVKSAKVEVFATEPGGALRRVVATAVFSAPGPQGKPIGGDVRFDLQVAKLDKPEKIVAPRNAVPFSRFDQSSLGFGQLSALSPGSGSSTTQPAEPAPQPRPSGSHKQAKSGGQSRQAADAAYVACVQQAFDVPSLMKCQAQLP